jgi:hypothetical protein
MFFSVGALMPCFAKLSLPVTLNEDTFFGVYANSQKLFDLYSQAVETLLKDNTELYQLESELTRHFGDDKISLKTHLKKVQKYLDQKLFIPDDSLWFALDTFYRPGLKIGGKIKPEVFFDHWYSIFGKPFQLRIIKKNESVVIVELPGLQFSISGKLQQDSMQIFVGNNKIAYQADSVWKEHFKNCNNDSCLLEARLDFDKVKTLLAQKIQRNIQSQCLGNLALIKQAMEMYRLDTGKKMQKLDLELLCQKNYLADIPFCSSGGQYKIEEGHEIEVCCSVHGTVINPKIQQGFRHQLADPRLKPFKAFFISITLNSIKFGLEISDKSTLEQWHAIIKQQLLTVEHMIRNLVGRITEEQKNKYIKLLRKVEVSVVDSALELSYDDFEPDTPGKIMVAMTAMLEAKALPEFLRARKAEVAKDCRQKRKKIKAAVNLFNSQNSNEMKILDQGMLVGLGFIKIPLQCLSVGVYSINAEGEVECSVHGY